jgi:hypothetical protein
MQVSNFWPLSSLKKSSFVMPIKLLSQRDRILLVAVVLITILLAFLDLLGVLLIGVIGSLSITGIGSGKIGDRVSVLNRRW